MPDVRIALTADVVDTPRVHQVAAMFDLDLQAKTSLDIAVSVPSADDDPASGGWQIGAIIGPSGSGKSTVAREAFKADLVGKFKWPRDKCIIDGFDDKLETRQIVATLNAVGFSSPPAWVLPYRLLSNGQQFRCDLARSLLCGRELVVFDEFTSVVDRQVGRAASFAVAKSVRKGHTAAKRFVAVTCHSDVIEWLQPDWVLDMSNRQLARGCLPRPDIRISIHQCKPDKGRDVWPLFARHHYLSAKMFNGATVYVAVWDGTLVAMCAVINNAGHKGRRIIHRLVVLPDYQGMGIGSRLLNAAAAIEVDTGHRVSICTSHPALIASLVRSDQWRCARITRRGRAQTNVARNTSFRNTGTRMASFSYWPDYQGLPLQS